MWNISVCLAINRFAAGLCGGAGILALSIGWGASLSLTNAGAAARSKLLLECTCGAAKRLALESLSSLCHHGAPSRIAFLLERTSHGSQTIQAI